LFSNEDRELVINDIKQELEAGGNKNPNTIDLKLEELTDIDLAIWQKHKDWLEWGSDKKSEEDLTPTDLEYIKKAQAIYNQYTDINANRKSRACLRVYIQDRLLKKQDE